MDWIVRNFAEPFQKWGNECRNLVVQVVRRLRWKGMLSRPGGCNRENRSCNKGWDDRWVQRIPKLALRLQKKEHHCSNYRCASVWETSLCKLYLNISSLLKMVLKIWQDFYLTVLSYAVASPSLENSFGSDIPTSLRWIKWSFGVSVDMYVRDGGRRGEKGEKIYELFEVGSPSNSPSSCLSLILNARITN